MKTIFTVAIIFLYGFAVDPGFAQTPFYQDKTISVVLGGPPAGSADMRTRAVTNILRKHIPGNPAVIVENMTGAGSVIAANYLYKIARPDGLTIGHYLGGIALQQLMIKYGIEFDARRFRYIGVPAQDNFIIGVHKSTGITDVNAWIASKQIVKFGGIGPGAGSDDIPKILAATINLPAQVVSGYKGTADTRLAFNNGEVQATSNAWESTKSTWKNELNSGMLKVVLQANLKSHPELKNIPVSYEMAKTEEAKTLMATVLRANSPTVRPFMAPPGTPEEPVQILRKAFMTTMNDPEFLTETKKANLDINPLDGAELEQHIKEIFKLDAAQIAKLKEILK